MRIGILLLSDVPPPIEFVQFLGLGRRPRSSAGNGHLVEFPIEGVDEHRVVTKDAGDAL
jgi:hypothetical protein